MVHRNFKQVPISQALLDYGLVKRSDGMPEPADDVLIPWQPIAGFSLEPGDLEPELGLLFQSTVDGLDELDLAVLDLASGRRVGLFRHRHSPAGGISLYILPQQYTDSRDIRDLMFVTGIVSDSVLMEAMSILEIVGSQVSWRRPRLVREPGDYPLSWPRISPVGQVIGPTAPAFAEPQVLFCFGTNPSVPTLQPTERSGVETVEFLTEMEVCARFNHNVIGWGKDPVCLVTLRGAFADQPPPQLGPSGFYSRVHVAFDGRTGQMSWVKTDLSEGAGLNWTIADER